MIILSCKLCGSRDVVRSSFFMNFVCKGCGRSLALHEVNFEQVDRDPVKEYSPVFAAQEGLAADKNKG